MAIHHTCSRCVRRQQIIGLGSSMTHLPRTKDPHKAESNARKCDFLESNRPKPKIKIFHVLKSQWRQPPLIFLMSFLCWEDIQKLSSYEKESRINYRID